MTAADPTTPRTKRRSRHKRKRPPRLRPFAKVTDDEEYVLALQTRRELLDDKTSKAFAILTGLALKMAVARMLDGREWVERELAIMRQNGHTLLFGYQREEDYLRDALGLDLTFTSGGEDVC